MKKRAIDYVKKKSVGLRQSPLILWAGRHKQGLSITIIILSLIFLVSYALFNPSIIEGVLRTDPRVLGLLLLLYILITGTQLAIIYVTIKLCGKELPLKKSLFLTIYSALANFFGPLQSGPGVRAVYLKRTIGLRVREYTFATLFYYFAYGSINASLLFINSWPILTVLGIILSIVLIIVGTKKFHFGNRGKYVFIIYLVAIAQVLITTTVYFTELHATSPAAHYSYLQALVFSASGGLSMFVSLTPGGIGIREAFIVFTQSLHHIPLSSVIAAGILDRAFYILFLVLLFIISSSFHIKEIVTRKKKSHIANEASSPHVT